MIPFGYVVGIVWAGLVSFGCVWRCLAAFGCVWTCLHERVGFTH